MKHGRSDTLEALTGSRGKHFYFVHSRQAGAHRLGNSCPDWTSAATVDW
jgi:hypothetical protein